MEDLISFFEYNSSLWCTNNRISFTKKIMKAIFPRGWYFNFISLVLIILSLFLGIQHIFLSMASLIVVLILLCVFNCIDYFIKDSNEGLDLTFIIVFVLSGVFVLITLGCNAAYQKGDTVPSYLLGFIPTCITFALSEVRFRLYHK